MTDAVFVRGLEFEGNHGYTAAERRGTRRFRVDLMIERDLSAAVASDRLADTVDYWKVSEVVVRLGTQSTYKLIEALAGTMADAIVAMYPGSVVTITLDKLAPPCPGVPAACGVRLRRG
jgi:dihydroneopterin aldolase